MLQPMLSWNAPAFKTSQLLPFYFPGLLASSVVNSLVRQQHASTSCVSGAGDDSCHGSQGSLWFRRAVQGGAGANDDKHQAAGKPLRLVPMSSVSAVMQSAPCCSPGSRRGGPGAHAQALLLLLDHTANHVMSAAAGGREAKIQWHCGGAEEDQGAERSHGEPELQRDTQARLLQALVQLCMRHATRQLMQALHDSWDSELQDKLVFRLCFGGGDSGCRLSPAAVVFFDL